MNTVERPGSPFREPRASLSLLDYRRTVADLYTRIRAAAPEDGHRIWIEGRDRLLADHPQSPIPADVRPAFGGLAVWDYRPELRFEVAIGPPASADVVGLPHSGDGVTTGRSAGTISIEIDGHPIDLQVFRLDQYGDHLFVPFVDGTAGSETYQGGRYVIDTAKGADLGSDGTRLVVDFNFAYHPSCVHDPIWSCPLAPASNRTSVAIRAGEHLPGTT